MKIRSFIRPLSGENEEREYVWKVMHSHPEWYGEGFQSEWLLNNTFYGIYNEAGELMGFFSVGVFHKNFYNNEAVINWVNIKDEYRKNGLFNKLVKFVKEKYSDYMHITIQGGKKNPTACEIYGRKFTFMRENDEGDGYWYVIVNREKQVL